MENVNFDLECIGRWKGFKIYLNKVTRPDHFDARYLHFRAKRAFFFSFSFFFFCFRFVVHRLAETL